MTIMRSLFILLLAPVWSYAGSLTPKTFQTKNHIPVYFVRRTQVPMLDIAVVFKAGSARDGEQAGLANLTQDLMGHETQDYTEKDLLDTIAKSGAQLNSELTRDMAIWELRTLTQTSKLRLATSVFQSVLTKPSFSEKIMSRVKDQLRVNRLRRSEDPIFVAKNAFFRSVYAGHPYAHSPLGSENSLKKIKPEDCLAFYQKHYTAKSAFIVMVGNVTLSKAKNLANKLSQDLMPGETLEPIEKAPENTHKNIYLSQDKAQTTLIIGQLGFPAYSDQHYAQMIGNHVLGGSGLDSLLAKHVRTQKGLAYHASSHMWKGVATGPFLMLSQSRSQNAKKAYQAMLKTYRQFLNKKITSSQLEAAKSSLIYRSQLENVTNESVLSSLVESVFYHFPADFLQTFASHIQAVTAQQVQKVFAMLKRRPLVSIAVGKTNVFSQKK